MKMRRMVYIDEDGDGSDTINTMLDQEMDPVDRWYQGSRVGLEQLSV